MENEKKLYGYARVSTKDQFADRQITALLGRGVPRKNIFVEKMSGKDFDRPQYKRMIKKLDSDSVLYIQSLDRLGRNYSEMNRQWRIITKDIGARVVVLENPILDMSRDDLVSKLIGDIVLSIFSFVAEQERINIQERTVTGIAAAKARGVRFGRAPKPLPDNFHEIFQKWKKKQISLDEAADACGMARTTFYDRARKYEKEKAGDS